MVETLEVILNAATVLVTAVVVHYVTLRSTRRRTLQKAAVHKQLETVENVVTALTNAARAMLAILRTVKQSETAQKLGDMEVVDDIQRISEETGALLRGYMPRMNLYLDSRFVAPWELGMTVRAERFSAIVEKGRKAPVDSAEGQKLLEQIGQLAGELEWMATQLALFTRSTFGMASKAEKRFMRRRTIELGTPTEWAQRIRGKHLEDAESSHVD